MDGYSQAEHHAAHGFAFVACDHLGVGDSSVPPRLSTTPRSHGPTQPASTWVLEQLRAGTWSIGRQVPITTAVGMGQSFGGFILTIGEGTTPVFDGVALLGWSGIETQPPWPPDVDFAALLSGSAGNGLEHPMRKTFHAPDVPDEIVIADMTKKAGGMGSEALWSADHSPGGPALEDPARGPLGPGVVAAEAAAIATPVFIGAGDIDVLADAHSEPVAYPSSRDVTVCVFPRMGHMHNFATTRVDLWNRLESWATAVAASGRGPSAHR